jgi:hypothetical protein
MKVRIKIVSGIFLFFFLVFISSFKLEFPYTVSIKGILLPEKEWNFLKTSSGTFLNILKDNGTHTVPFFSNSEFGRGDQVEFALRANAVPGSEITKGDTIGNLYSHQEEFKLLELQRELIEQKRLRDINLTGEKPQRTKAALEELRLAETNLESEERNFQRSKQLYEAEVISEEAFELAENLYKQKQQQVLIAEAKYEDLTAGSKREEIELVNATIEALQKEIDKTLERLSALTIKSPVTGIFSTPYNPGIIEEEVLARVINNKNMIVMAPVEISQTPFLSDGMTIKVTDPHSGIEIDGKVLFVDNNVKSLDGRQMVFVTGLIPNEEGLLSPNLKVEGVIVGKTVSLVEHSFRLFGTIFTN